MFDETKASRAENFFERLLTHTKGIYARTPFELHPWERSIIRDIFGTVKPDGRRQYQTCYIEIGKKNGKTELGSGLAIFGLIADGEAGCEVYSAASTRDQASICFNTAAQMVRNHHELSRRVRVYGSTKTMVSREDPSSFYRAISADADINDGINPHFAIFDELHRQKNRKLYDVLYRGMSTRTQPLMVMLTTAGVVGESELCWEMHEYARQILQGVFKDPTFYPVIYGLDESEDWQDEGKPAEYRERTLKGKKTFICIAPATGWYKANPALGSYLRLDKLQEEFQRALRVPSEQNSFRRFRLSQWVSQETRWISMDEWDPCGEAFNPDDFVGKQCYAGLDLSTSIDITAFVKVFPKDDRFYVVPRFWVPEAVVRKRMEQGDQRFSMWQKQGLLEVTDGNLIDFRKVRQQIEDDSNLYDLLEVAYDPWNATEIIQNLADSGLKMIPLRQGLASMSPPTKEFEGLVLGRRLRHGGHPVLRWMMDCTTVKADNNDNRRPVKPDRLKSSKRIDGIVASIMGIDRAIRNENQQSVYNTRGLIVV